MIRTALICCAFCLLDTACKINYSFTGASIPPDVKTISIKDFANRAPLAQPTLSQTFSESLKDYFQSQTNLTLVSKFGDLQLEGEIIKYDSRFTAISGNETAAMNRLTITVQARFVNTKDETKNFEQSFSRYADYESSKLLSDVEDDLVTEIIDQLKQDIFNKAVSNW